VHSLPDGAQGDMDWLARAPERRADPGVLIERSAKIDVESFVAMWRPRMSWRARRGIRARRRRCATGRSPSAVRWPESQRRHRRGMRNGSSHGRFRWGGVGTAHATRRKLAVRCHCLRKWYRSSSPNRFAHVRSMQWRSAQRDVDVRRAGEAQGGRVLHDHQALRAALHR
jgi:hypothetical protein